jgi:outer membrane protein W
VQINNSKEVENIYGYDAQFNETADSLGTFTTKDNFTWISFGGSYHFSQMERLSPYVALDFMIGTSKYQETAVKTDGLSYDPTENSTYTSKESGLGLNIAGGFDYYFAENVFIGGEVGLMFMSAKDKGGSYTYGTTTEATLPAGSISSFGNSATAAIRLGWRF